MRLVETSQSGTDMIRAPNATEVSHLFALAEHEIIKGRLTEALILLRFIRSIDPDHTDAAARLALTLFRREQWNEAWDAFDIRFKLMSAQPAVKVRTADGGTRELPRWRGGEPPKRLLVMDEQGLGDTIQFMRYLKILADQGVEINFVTHEILFDLIRTMNVPMTLLPSNKPGSVNGATGWTPLLHIPRALGLDPKRYGEGIPYIVADPARVKSWSRRVLSKGFKVGICWGGNPDSPAEKGRSIPLEAFAPLAALPGVRLFSLQKGVPTKEISQASFRRELFDFGDDLDGGGKAFMDTMAIMMSLDLVVTADTSIAHVAGALGKPVYILLRKEPDWRWLLRESDTVWYPSARLFRQRISGDWSEPMALVAAAIAAQIEPANANPPVDQVTKIAVSPGELAEQIAKWSVFQAVDADRSVQAPQRLSVLRSEFEKLFFDNALISSLQKEIEENARRLAEAELQLKSREQTATIDHAMLQLIRDVRRMKEAHEEMVRRMDALHAQPPMTGKPETNPKTKPESRAVDKPIAAEATRPQRAGHKKKA
jgi:hypothetical protein